MKIWMMLMSKEKAYALKEGVLRENSTKTSSVAADYSYQGLQVRKSNKWIRNICGEERNFKVAYKVSS